MAVVPILLVVRVMKTAENATAYSINNTARQVLWLPTTAEMKYKAKPAIETFFVRFGDGLAAATILVGVHLFALSTQSFFLVNVALVVAGSVAASSCASTAPVRRATCRRARRCVRAGSTSTSLVVLLAHASAAATAPERPPRTQDSTPDAYLDAPRP